MRNSNWLSLLLLPTLSFAMETTRENLLPFLVDVKKTELPAITAAPVSEYSFENLSLRVVIISNALQFFDLYSGTSLGALDFSSPILHVANSDETLDVYIKSPRFHEKISMVFARNVPQLSDEQSHLVSTLTERLFCDQKLEFIESGIELYLDEKRIFNSLPLQIKSVIEPYVINANNFSHPLSSRNFNSRGKEKAHLGVRYGQ